MAKPHPLDDDKKLPPDGDSGDEAPPTPTDEPPPMPIQDPPSNDTPGAPMTVRGLPSNRSHWIVA